MPEHRLTLSSALIVHHLAREPLALATHLKHHHADPTTLQPCFFLANNYVLLSHLALALGEDVSSRCLLIRRTLLVKIFLGADIITFIIQGGAGGMSASGGDMANLGEKMMLVGLILQVVTFGLFVMVLAHFGFKV